MAYVLVEVEVTEPLPEVTLGADDEGVGLVSRRHGRVVGFALHRRPGGSRLGPAEIAALLDPDPGGDPGRDGPGPGPGETDFASAAPSVTAAVCTKDRPELLRACLGALAATVTAPDELLVVDNAPSDDRTAVVAAAAGARYAVEPCPGLDFARNRTLACAGSDVVAFLDDDVIVDPHWLDAVRGVWQRDPTAGGMTGQVLPYELATDAQVAFERLGGFRGGNRRVRHCLPGPPGDRIFPYGAGDFGTGANFAVHRTTALRLGAFDEALDTGPPLPGVATST